ncbi:MAG: ATP synthase F0 subunit B [Acidobacteria bacterium]|nr:ATP synthase F0 subunit B [Acidobacteriota bacterium]MBI3655829.1 ATP synthase F0 subunit B [Acidobacteriota bacterium]
MKKRAIASHARLIFCIAFVMTLGVAFALAVDQGHSLRGVPDKPVQAAPPSGESATTATHEPSESKTAAPTGGHAGQVPADHEAGHKKEAHKGWGLLDTFGKIVNFLVLGGALGYLLKAPLQKFIAQRGHEIQQKLHEAQAARADANAKLAEVQAALARLDAELKSIREQAEREAEVERQRIAKSAQADTDKILGTAKREIENLTKSARADLRSYAAELTVGLAEEMIQRDLKVDDDREVFSRFLDNLKSGSGSVH